jgi:uncharacterized membrane protein YfcA
VAVYVLVGAYFGTRFLVIAPQQPVRVLLACVIFAYLYQHRLAQLDWSWLTRYPRFAAMVFGLAGGFFSGSVNNSLPPLLIYFMLLGLEATVMTQVLNLCFLGGKVVQAATLGFSGEINVSAALANLPLTAIAVAGMIVGTHCRRWFNPESYTRALRRVLFAIALLLIGQAAWSLFH